MTADPSGTQRLASPHGDGGPYRLKSGPLSSHGRILNFLQELPRTVRILDVGTSTGYLGAALRHLGFQHVSGIEREASCADQARPSYERLAVCDMEWDALPWKEASFDVIICADVLEHLVEPAQVLRRLSRLIASGGWIVISLPNIAHWSARLSLLLGRFRYASCGLFDRGHVRFFTRQTARELLKEAELTLGEALVTPLPIAHWCRDSAWTPCWRMIERLDWCLARLWPSLFAYQFVFVARRSAA